MLFQWCDVLVQLLQRMGEGRHQSCLLVTSREKPKEVAPLEGENGQRDSRNGPRTR